MGRIYFFAVARSLTLTNSSDMSTKTAAGHLEEMDVSLQVVGVHSSFNSAVMMEEGHAPSDHSPTDDSDDPHIQLESDALLYTPRVTGGPMVKVTAWRLLNTVLILGLGTYKASAAYRGQQVAPTTLDWIIGVLWAVTAYWLSFLEESQLGPGGRWFFARDLSGALRIFLGPFILVCLIVLLIWQITTAKNDSLQMMLCASVPVLALPLSFFSQCLCARRGRRVQHALTA
ncbi:hypothetical protein C8R45DRAFT_394937 [Mycena sanguinolenta]|nr:hypothetical protein C8R45DRAFT_394937 [Mycena sanguinolenta]